jgi:hypothetical protein
MFIPSHSKPQWDSQQLLLHAFTLGVLIATGYHAVLSVLH